MDFLPILSTLRRHRTAAGLIVLEIALTCAIVCNAIFLIGDRLARMDRPSGLVEDELVSVRVGGIGTAANAEAVTEQDLVALRAIPGVTAVAIANMIPFGNSSWNSDVSLHGNDEPGSVNAATYMGSQDLLEVLGIRLVAGRDFTPEEYVRFKDGIAGIVQVPSIIVSRELADRLFPGEDPLGKRAYVIGRDPQIIVGVIERLARPNETGGAASAGFAVVLPMTVPYTAGGRYLLRVAPARKAEVLAAVDAVLNRVDPNRIIQARQTFAELRQDYFKQDRSMAYLLSGVTLALLIVTALGVIGLASFWVQQRRRQIGIRRALGATRHHIVRYFQLENFILTTIGIALGMGLAYAINLWLMDKYGVARLPASFLPAGAVLLWGLGQLAVLGPALRASQIPPAIATRSM
jgi:putative ABC transport system permease protein